MVLLVFGLLIGSVAAFWRLPCANPLLVERADPIMSPGTVAGHVHTISGGSGFGLNATFASLRKSECSSCLIKSYQDSSNYWSPTVYFAWKNGSFTPVEQVGGSLIYYLPRFNSLDKTNVTAFPDGLKMLTGTPKSRSYAGTTNQSSQANLMAQAIGFNCLGATGTTRNPYLPTQNCPNGLRGEIRFPSCWDGVNVDSANHQSHMAYPIENESGPCPAGYPVRLVTLFYEVMWSVDPMKSIWSQALNTTQPFVLASGDSTGYGYHADFMSGWDRSVLQKAINTCTSASGVIEECPVFDLNNQTTQTCRRTPDINEIVSSTISPLPGCNPVTSGPADATTCSAAAPLLFSSPVVYRGGAPPPGAGVPADQPRVLTSYSGWTHSDCYSDAGNPRGLSNGISNPQQTVEGCLNAVSAAGYSIAGVEYHGECWGANVLANTSVTTPGAYGSCSLVCNGNSLEYCGGANFMDVYVRSPATQPARPSLASQPRVVQTFGGWNHSSCSSDSTSHRVLATGLNNPNNTVEGCLNSATSAGFKIAGIEYGGECWGGASLSNTSSVIPQTSCNMHCNGNLLQLCGGSNAMDLYYFQSTSK